MADIVLYRIEGNDVPAKEAVISEVYPRDNACTLVFEHGYFLSKSRSPHLIRKIETLCQSKTTWGSIDSYDLHEPSPDRVRNPKVAGATRGALGEAILETVSSTYTARKKEENKKQTSKNIHNEEKVTSTKKRKKNDTSGDAKELDKTKDVGKPKRGLSAVLYYSNDMHSKRKNDNPGMHYLDLVSYES